MNKTLYKLSINLTDTHFGLSIIYFKCIYTKVCHRVESNNKLK